MKYARLALIWLLGIFAGYMIHPRCMADTFGLHVASIHAPRHDLNNTNPGLYFRSDSGLTMGAYLNSYRKTSAYIGYTHEWGDFALTAGVISGYRYPFMLAPTYRFASVNGYDLRLAYLPRIGKDGAHVVHVMIEKEF